ncbi:hypothetical protein DXG01_015433, partial [Tephrocybe rancida]
MSQPTPTAQTLDKLDVVLKICDFLPLKDVHCLGRVNKTLNEYSKEHMYRRLLSLLSNFIKPELHPFFWAALNHQCGGLTGDITLAFLGRVHSSITNLRILVQLDMEEVLQFIRLHLTMFIEELDPKQRKWNGQRKVRFVDSDSGLTIIVVSKELPFNDILKMVTHHFSDDHIWPGFITQHSILFTSYIEDESKIPIHSTKI